MALNRQIVATTRRSNLVSTFGVGALLPSEDDSFMIAGLDEWPGCDSWEGDEVVSEPRLAASLGVRGFRSPSTWRKEGDVPARRFPRWAFCTNPDCRRLGPWWAVSDPAKRRCGDCYASLSPSRFVSCCVSGHIEDFPYIVWVHEGHVEEPKTHKLRLRARGVSSALSDLVVECSCGRKRSMEGAFDRGALRGLKSCSGGRPWLRNNERGCREELRTLQRGSSNVWFPQTRSAISIPSPRQSAEAFVHDRLRLFENATAEILASMKLPPGVTEDLVVQAFRRITNPAITPERPTDADLRAQEYSALCAGLDDPETSTQFQCAEVDLTGSDTPPIIKQVSRVSRLREVRALVGFTRVYPASDEKAVTVAPLTEDTQPTWYPAIEVLGEGVFVQLDGAELDRWATSQFAVHRSRLLEEARDRSGPSALATTLDLAPRAVALHSLAHLLIDEMSLTAGYPAGSLRERVYDGEGQAGVLVYTATADSAGSLGGLAALSDKDRFAGLLLSGVDRAHWCTSDPVCIESEANGVDGLNLAACHACLLVPETSCERFNLVLDRACLIGTPEEESAGLFGDFPTAVHRLRT
ncbi:DrmB family protein [Arsenicicoccus cauae]|uniref:DrmB family protein n=1 Tax=Arsenicicoccus cauae TaxID=2663847 RepID=UPI00370D6D9D